MTAKDHLFNAIHPALEDVGISSRSSSKELRMVQLTKIQVNTHRGCLRTSVATVPSAALPGLLAYVAEHVSESPEAEIVLLTWGELERAEVRMLSADTDRLVGLARAAEVALFAAAG